MQLIFGLCGEGAPREGAGTHDTPSAAPGQWLLSVPSHLKKVLQCEALTPSSLRPTRSLNPPTQVYASLEASFAARAGLYCALGTHIHHPKLTLACKVPVYPSLGCTPHPALHPPHPPSWLQTQGQSRPGPQSLGFLVLPLDPGPPNSAGPSGGPGGVQRAPSRPVTCLSYLNLHCQLMYSNRQVGDRAGRQRMMLRYKRRRGTQGNFEARSRPYMHPRAASHGHLESRRFEVQIT